MTERADFKDSIRQLAATVLVDATKPEAPEKTDPRVENEAPEANGSPRPRTRTKPAARTLRAARPESPLRPNVVSITTRLPREVDDLVEKASFAQRMNGLSPGTKQEILAEAARDWLRRSGYIRMAESDAEESADDLHGD
jgi:hypothetical protein